MTSKALKHNSRMIHDTTVQKIHTSHPAMTIQSARSIPKQILIKLQWKTFHLDRCTRQQEREMDSRVACVCTRTTKVDILIHRLIPGNCAYASYAIHTLYKRISGIRRVHQTPLYTTPTTISSFIKYHRTFPLFARRQPVTSPLPPP